MNAQPKTVPEGYMVNRKNHLVPVETIDQIDIARDDLVNEFYEKALEQQQLLITLKQQLFADFDAFVSLSADKYDVELGGAKGNVTLTSYDGKTQVKLQQQDRWDYDERLNVAKELIDEFFSDALDEIEDALESGGEGANHAALQNMKQIKALIDDVFQVGKKGKINLGRILGLRHYKFKHPKWEKAMEAISDSIHSDGTTPYIRLYRKNEQGQFKQVVLDFAGL